LRQPTRIIRRLPGRAIEELERSFEAINALESKKLEFEE
jgi:hypothetical protein